MKLIPTGERLLVRRYTLPERIGSIIVPDSWRETGQTSVWELEAWGPKVVEALGFEPVRGSIIEAEPWTAVSLGDNVSHSLGFEAYMLDLKNVLAYTPWESSWNE